MSVAMSLDLRSDTVTRPTAAMRQAMATAEVGDDVLDGDPTTRRLEALVAERLGKDKALFFPSGSMANQAAIWVHTTPGTELLCDAEAHIFHWEIAAVAGLCGVQCRPVKGQTRTTAPVAPSPRVTTWRHCSRWRASITCRCTSMARGFGTPPRRWGSRWPILPRVLIRSW